MNNLLGAKSHFSLGESIYDPSELVKKAELAGYDGLVVTDVESIDAMPTLMSKAKSLRIGLGVQLAVVEDLSWVAAKRGEPKRKPNPVFVTTLFVRNDEGFRDLCELMTLAQSEDHYCSKPARSQISREELVAFVGRGNLTMTLGSSYSALQLSDKEKLIDMLCDHLDVSQVLSEIVPVKSLYYDAHNARAFELNVERGINGIVVRPTLNQKGEVGFRNTMNSILSHDKVDGMFRREPAEDFHVLEQAEWLDEVAAMVSRVCNIVDDGALGDVVTEFVNQALAKTDSYFVDHPYQWKKMIPSLPTMSSTPMADIVAICKKGWKDRLGTEVFGYKPAASDLPKYQERLKYELSILQKMEFEAYFQLVHYVVNWSKQNEIMVGPGRGSVGGSLVAYLMGITDVDPIRFNLIFERFINPERIDLPDIDLDFMSSRRQDIVDHLVSKFGADKVVQIANYNTIAGAGAIQAVGKAYGLHESQYECSKLVPKESGVPVPLEKAVAYVPELENFALNHPEAWAASVGLQGTFKNFAKHAAGVVVAGEKVINRGVVNSRQGVGIVNWDKRVVEDFGLIKLDVLGLSNLDILRLCKEYIWENYKVAVDFTKLPLDDKKVLDSFAAGKTYGVFQFESGGMRKLLKELGLGGNLTFEDCVAATALFRPGPIQSGMMDAYVAVKKEFAEPEYAHKAVVDTLTPTMGVVVYQEQTMQMTRDLAGFTFAEADGVRKAIGKKDPVKMAAIGVEFKDKAVMGWIKVELDDGSIRVFHKGEKIKCKDGVDRTIEQVIKDDAEF